MMGSRHLRLRVIYSRTATKWLSAGENGRPKRIVIDIDGDGSFLMNCQELATARVEGLDVKTVILNNQHLGMVVQWEDRFYKANRAHTYLGRKDGAPCPPPTLVELARHLQMLLSRGRTLRLHLVVGTHVQVLCP
jgi:Thiamine pyrophosphate enzyme, C-terminal TPP binding domain